MLFDPVLHHTAPDTLQGLAHRLRERVKQETDVVRPARQVVEKLRPSCAPDADALAGALDAFAAAAIDPYVDHGRRAGGLGRGAAKTCGGIAGNAMTELPGETEPRRIERVTQQARPPVKSEGWAPGFKVLEWITVELEPDAPDQYEAALAGGWTAPRG